jgi:hypothetical protein
MQSHIRPRRWSIVAPGQHGEPRTGGQSLISGLEGQPCYRPCSSAGPTGHAMIKSGHALLGVASLGEVPFSLRGSQRGTAPRRPAQCLVRLTTSHPVPFRMGA